MFFFFLQAEDGIRDWSVTGVQTCALPISRTVPFVSKATAVPLAKAAARIALGATIADLRAEGMLPPTGDGGAVPPHVPIAVKGAVLPFKRFRTPGGKGVEHLPGPEMKSTGEVMGI